MKKLLVPTLLLMSMTAVGAVDYSSCMKSQAGLMGRINEKGEITPLPGEKMNITKNEDGIESVDITAVTGQNIKFKLLRDKENRIVSASDVKDLSEISKKERNDLLMREATLLAFDSQGTCQGMGGGSWNENGYGGGWSVSSRECASVNVWDPELKRYAPADYSMINKKNFSKFKFSGISTWDEFVKARAFDKKRWKADEKVIKAYAKSLEQTGWAMPTGTVSSFDFKDGKCFLKKVEKNLLVGKTGAMIRSVEYDSESCDRMKPIFEKYDNKLHQCKLDNYAASNEVSLASMNIKPSEVLISSPVDLIIDFSGIPKGTVFERNRQNCLIYSQDFPKQESIPGKAVPSSATKQ